MNLLAPQRADQLDREQALLAHCQTTEALQHISRIPMYIQLQYYHFQYGFMVFHDLVKSYVGLSRATASERLFLTQLDFDEILFEAIIRKTKNCSFAIGPLILQQLISKYLQYARCRIICEWNIL